MRLVGGEQLLLLLLIRHLHFWLSVLLVRLKKNISLDRIRIQEGQWIWIRIQGGQKVSGMGKKSRSRMKIPYHISESLVFWIKNAYILLCGSGNLFDLGSGIEKF
jgi:hypothetical protein